MIFKKSAQCPESAEKHLTIGAMHLHFFKS